MNPAAALGVALLMTQPPPPPASPHYFGITDLSRTVVLLQNAVPQFMNVEGVQKEVWLKGPSDAAPVRHGVPVSGTGFLVVSRDRLILVTAAHVAEAMGPTTTVTIAGPTDQPASLSLAELAGTSRPTWLLHSSADAAVMQLRPSQPLVDGLLKGRFAPDVLLSPSNEAPSREAQLTVIGFPKGLGVGARFSPLTLQTFAASGLFSHRRFDKAIDTPFFFLQDPSVGGYSGAPVYDVSIRNLGGAVVTGDGTRCYGLVHGTLGDETGGKLSAVVPIQAVLELLAQPTLP